MDTVSFVTDSYCKGEEDALLLSFLVLSALAASHALAATATAAATFRLELLEASFADLVLLASVICRANGRKENKYLFEFCFVHGCGCAFVTALVVSQAVCTIEAGRNSYIFGGAVGHHVRHDDNYSNDSTLATH